MVRCSNVHKLKKNQNGSNRINYMHTNLVQNQNDILDDLNLFVRDYFVAYLVTYVYYN